MRSHHSVFALFGVLTLALAGCSGGGESASPSTSPGPGDAASAESAEPSATAASKADAGATKDKVGGKEGTADSPSFVAGITIDEATGFNVNSSSIPTAAGQTIGGINAFCEPSDEDHVRLAANVSPHVNWGNSPATTRSFALVAVDPDSPAVADDVNKKDVSIPLDAERADFYHWVVVDIPAELTEIKLGASSKEVVPGGKAPGKRPWGVEGVNSYGAWFKDDEKMAGEYGGWDGPCPPWNDERPHRYIFTLYALDVATLGLTGSFTGDDVLAKVKDHTLAKATFTGIYSLN